MNSYPQCRKTGRHSASACQNFSICFMESFHLDYLAMYLDGLCLPCLAKIGYKWKNSAGRCGVDVYDNDILSLPVLKTKQNEKDN